jgi:hypothetical protein
MHDDPELGIESWVQKGRILERQRIMAEVYEVEELSNRTRTPLFQDKLFEIVKDIIDGVYKTTS